jgi:hypothetical protein
VRELLLRHITAALVLLFGLVLLLALGLLLHVVAGGS